MNNRIIDKLKLQLDSLAVFGGILQDPPMEKFIRYLQEINSGGHNGVRAYAEFVSALQLNNGGNLSLYVQNLCYKCDNALVKIVGKGLQPSEQLWQNAKNELKILQSVADVTWRELTMPLDYGGYLPEYSNQQTEIEAGYIARVKDIGRFGYGKYAFSPMFIIDDDANIIPVENPDGVRLKDLTGYAEERRQVVDNTRALIKGKPAANALLTGDAGTGKSTTIKAVENEFFVDGLRLIEMRKSQLFLLPRVLDELAGNPLKFIIFIDDISFVGDDDCFNALKAVLEGSVSARSENVAVYATSNRRHIVKERFSDRDGDEIHLNDTLQEIISLSERFGLQVTFRRPDKQLYLDIVEKLAKSKGVEIPNKTLAEMAERFALSHGGRSPRHARQFVDALVAETLCT